MYFYFYDTFLAASKYHSVLSKIEARLMNLGITGKIGRCSPLKSSRDLLFDAVKLGLKNIIVVGNDKTFYRALRDIVEKDVTLGYIPMEKHSMLAPIFGIPFYKTSTQECSRIFGMRRALQNFIRFGMSEYHDLQSRYVSQPRCDESYKA